MTDMTDSCAKKIYDVRILKFDVWFHLQPLRSKVNIRPLISDKGNANG